MKLLKLVYLAHGWHLGFTEDDLISEAVEAWKYGPVVKSVYHEFKKYGDEKINQLASRLQVINSDEIIFKNIIPEVDRASSRTIKLLDLVWNSYNGYTGLELSSITHQPGSPWDIVYNQGGGKGRLSVPIPNDIIKDYYKDKVEKLGIGL